MIKQLESFVVVTVKSKLLALLLIGHLWALWAETWWIVDELTFTTKSFLTVQEKVLRSLILEGE